MLLLLSVFVVVVGVVVVEFDPLYYISVSVSRSVRVFLSFSIYLLFCIGIGIIIGIIISIIDIPTNLFYGG